MTRGDVYWAELEPRSGSEQRGRRPVIIVSHNSFNMVLNWRSVMVVPISTSANQARRGPTALPISKGKAGLPHASVALCHQVTTLDRSKLTEFIGRLSPQDLASVERGLKVAMDLG